MNNSFLLEKFLKHPKFVYANTGSFNVNDFLSVETEGHDNRPFAPMFYGKRIDFDAFLLNESASNIRRRF